KDNIKFIDENFDAFSSKNWKFNDFLLHYSFLNIKDIELEKIAETEDPEEALAQSKKLFLLYKKDWRNKKQNRLNVLEKTFTELAKLPIEKSMEKFVTYKDETKMIYDAFRRAASDLENAMQTEMERAILYHKFSK